VPQRSDDPTINDSERLWRRVHPNQIRTDTETGEPEISSAAFSTREEVSVSIADETNLTAFLRDYPQHSVVEFTAGAARAANCTIVRDPLPDDLAHALVCGSRSHGQLSKTQQERLKQASRIIVRRAVEQSG
jgi:hypothetical protein